MLVANFSLECQNVLEPLVHKGAVREGSLHYAQMKISIN
jgi:hypothetical protein